MDLPIARYFNAIRFLCECILDGSVNNWRPQECSGAKVLRPNNSTWRRRGVSDINIHEDVLEGDVLAMATSVNACLEAHLSCEHSAVPKAFRRELSLYMHGFARKFYKNTEVNARARILTRCMLSLGRVFR
jgi:hypothetical protein